MSAEGGTVKYAIKQRVMDWFIGSGFDHDDPVWHEGTKVGLDDADLWDTEEEAKDALRLLTLKVRSDYIRLRYATHREVVPVMVRPGGKKLVGYAISASNLDEPNKEWAVIDVENEVGALLHDDAEWVQVEPIYEEKPETRELMVWVPKLEIPF